MFGSFFRRKLLLSVCFNELETFGGDRILNNLIKKSKFWSNILQPGKYFDYRFFGIFLLKRGDKIGDGVRSGESHIGDFDGSVGGGVREMIIILSSSLET